MKGNTISPQCITVNITNSWHCISQSTDTRGASAVYTRLSFAAFQAHNAFPKLNWDMFSVEGPSNFTFSKCYINIVSSFVELLSLFLVRSGHWIPLTVKRWDWQHQTNLIQGRYLCHHYTQCQWVSDIKVQRHINTKGSYSAKTGVNCPMSLNRVH